MVNVTTTIITIILFIGAGAWTLLILYWGLGKLGLWKFATYRRLKRRFKDYEFKDNVVIWCAEKIKRGWKFKDVRRISKYETNRGEIIFTYLSLTKLPKDDLEAIERGLVEKDGQRINGVEGESGEVIPKT